MGLHQIWLQYLLKWTKKKKSDFGADRNTPRPVATSLDLYRHEEYSHSFVYVFATITYIFLTFSCFEAKIQGIHKNIITFLKYTLVFGKSLEFS